MESLTQSLLGFIETHQAWAPLLVGLLAFGESLVLLGVFIPATALLLVVGGLAGSGVLSPVPLVLAASSAPSSATSAPTSSAAGSGPVSSTPALSAAIASRWPGPGCSFVAMASSRYSAGAS